MPIPDDTIFGPWPNGAACSYGDVRRMSEYERLESLKRRLDTFLIGQTQELAVDAQNKRKVYSPFPLAVMTCVAIEATGQIFYGVRNREAEGTRRDCFVAVAKSLHQNLSRPLTIEFRQQMKIRWPASDLTDCTHIVDLLYRFFRNSLIHAYRGHAVYLTEEDTATYKLDDGFLILNPYWFWTVFLDAYKNLWNEVSGAQANNPRRISCIGYLNELLN